MKNLIYLLLLPTLLGLACTEQPLAPDPSSVSAVDTTPADTFASPISGVWLEVSNAHTNVITITDGGVGVVKGNHLATLPADTSVCHTIDFRILGHIANPPGTLDNYRTLQVLFGGRSIPDTVSYEVNSLRLHFGSVNQDFGLRPWGSLIQAKKIGELSTLLYYEDFGEHVGFDHPYIDDYPATTYPRYSNAGPAAVEECNGYHAEMVGAEIRVEEVRIEIEELEWGYYTVQNAYITPFVKGLKLKSLDVANGQRVELTFKCDQELIENVQSINNYYFVFVDYGVGFKADSVTVERLDDGPEWYTYRGEFEVPAGCSVYSIDLGADPNSWADIPSKIDDIKLVALPPSASTE